MMHQWKFTDWLSANWRLVSDLRGKTSEKVMQSMQFQMKMEKVFGGDSLLQEKKDHEYQFNSQGSPGKHIFTEPISPSIPSHPKDMKYPGQTL